MCMACEEEALWRRYQLHLAVERDEIPPGFEPEDFQWAGLPVPSKRAPAMDASADLPARPADPSSADSRESGNSEKLGPRVRGDERSDSNPFACDAPDDR